MLFAFREVRIEKNFALGLCLMQDLGHSFSRYGPPGWEPVSNKVTKTEALYIERVL